MSVVFDVGGTSLRFALFDPATGRLSGRGEVATPNYMSSPKREGELVAEVLASMRRCVLEHRAEQPAASIIAALPGPVIDGEYVSHLPTILGAPLGEPLAVGTLMREVFGTHDVRLLNDITAAGYRFLDRHGPDFAVISVGSGVGSKLFLGGRPIVGRLGDAGEIGHLALDSADLDAPCECGGNGHVGALASGRGIVRLGICRARANLREYRSSQPGAFCPVPERLNTAVLAAAFRDGDPWTLRLARASLEPLAQAMATIRAATGIARYVLIGGLAIALGQRYVEALQEACARHYAWASWNDSIHLGPGDDCNGLIGAGIYSCIEEDKACTW